MKKLAIIIFLFSMSPLLLSAEQGAKNIVEQLLDGTSTAPETSEVAVTSSVIATDANIVTAEVPAISESELQELSTDILTKSKDEQEEMPRIPHTIPGQEINEEPSVYVIHPTNTPKKAVEKVVVEAEESFVTSNEIKKAIIKPGIIVGKITDYKNQPLKGVKVVFFSTNYYKEMKSTAAGNFGFSITETNEYTLTAQYGNQFYYTNLFFVPGEEAFVPLKFSVPMTVYGQLFIDGKPAQYGLFLRLIGKHGGQAGGIVLSNGMFHIKNLTPGKYTMVLERRKRFIDRRLNETRFYYVPITLTTETARIYIERDKRRIFGNVIINGLPRRHVDALVILKDAQTGGLLIHREAHTYYNQGYFCFENILPGNYILQAAQNQREWMSEKILVTVPPKCKSKKVVIDVVPDPNVPAKRLRDLRRQFLDE